MHLIKQTVPATTGSWCPSPLPDSSVSFAFDPHEGIHACVRRPECNGQVKSYSCTYNNLLWTNTPVLARYLQLQTSTSFYIINALRLIFVNKNNTWCLLKAETHITLWKTIIPINFGLIDWLIDWWLNGDVSTQLIWSGCTSLTGCLGCKNIFSNSVWDHEAAKDWDYVGQVVWSYFIYIFFFFWTSPHQLQLFARKLFYC